MAIKTRIEPISRDIAVIVRSDLSPEARSAALAEFARTAIAEAAETNRRALGRVPDSETRVDGRAGAPIDGVKPEGRVDVEFDLFVDVFTFILAELRRLSPVKSGAYRDGHRFFADHVEADPARPPRASEYVFTNLVPYARKIEVGKIKFRMPPHVYERAAQLARRRFGNLARIRFGFRSAEGGALESWASRTSLQRRDRSRAASERTRAEWLRRQPAIIVTLD